MSIKTDHGELNKCFHLSHFASSMQHHKEYYNNNVNANIDDCYLPVKETAELRVL
jgi:hypothetical protein